MIRGSRLNAFAGTVAFLLSLGVYATCVTPTVPFWDSGEFIATSHILGIPHPPGTPLYVLIGRLFSLLPLGSIAVRVNLLSSVASAVAVLFTCLVASRLTRRVLGGGAPDWAGPAGGLTAAFFTAFAPTFWDSAVEAEVYGLSAAVMAGCLWLALRWWDRVEPPESPTAAGGIAPADTAVPAAPVDSNRTLWLILYILFLAIGIHLGTFLVFPCIYLLVTMVRWGQVRRGWFWGSVALFVVAQFLRMNVIQEGFRATGDTELAFMSEGTRNLAGTLSLVGVAALAWNLVAVLGWRSTALIGALGLLGVSVHAFLLIRANLHPAINEAEPTTLKALWLVLIRDQYKPPEPIFRKTGWAFQFGPMYFRYLKEQFVLFGAGNGLTWVVPLALACGGLVVSAFRSRRTFWFLLTLALITGPFLVWYLNFSDHEVRERDYFFAAHYNILALWIGLGVAAAAAGLAARAGKWAGLAAAGFGIVLATLPLVAGADNQNFHRHDRRGNYLAHDYGYNMLVGLAPDAILFTNGDNDTFPLWYLQQVEGMRRDVRVVNLSLLQTEWYARQLRDREPKIPLALTDAEIAAVAPVRAGGRVQSIKEVLVRKILAGVGGTRPCYIAVTVPDLLGLDDRLAMEGLVQRIHDRPVEKNLDVTAAFENLTQRYRYRGFMNADGTADRRVYRDTQAQRLLQNYAAVGVRTVTALHQAGRQEDAVRLMRWVREAAPETRTLQMAVGLSFERIGAWDDARTHYESMLQRLPGDAEILGQVGHVLAAQGDSAAAVDWLEKGRAAAPGRYFNTYAELATWYRHHGRLDRARDLIGEWLRYNPGDKSGQTLARQLQ